MSVNVSPPTSASNSQGNDQSGKHLCNFKRVSMFKSLKCWYINADYCLTNKINDLKCRVSTSKPGIITVTEIFPQHRIDNITAAELLC